jgi:hypothetical protein
LRVLAPDATPAQTVQALLNMSDEQILDFIRRYIAWQNAAGFHSGEV